MALAQKLVIYPKASGNVLIKNRVQLTIYYSSLWFSELSKNRLHMHMAFRDIVSCSLVFYHGIFMCILHTAALFAFFFVPLFLSDREFFITVSLVCDVMHFFLVIQAFP